MNAAPDRVAVLSVHTSPLDRAGEGDGGGLNVTVDQTSRLLADRGVNVDVYTRAAAPGLPTSVEVHRGPTGATYRVHHVPAGPPGPVAKEDQPNLLCGLLLALERGPWPRPDLIHAHYWLSGWVGRRLAARWQVPLVQTFHTLGVQKNAYLAPGDRAEPALRLIAEASVVRAADRVTVMTGGEAALLHRTYGVPMSRLQVVPAGVDLSRFTPTPPAAGTTSASGAGTDTGRPPTLLFVGRLQPLKGPDVAIRTLAAVRRSVPDAQLRIVGGVSGAGDGTVGPQQLRALAGELGVADAVHLEPAVPQEQLPDVYREADVVLAPSRSETFGLVALEAQACGIPVVAADVSGLRAVVREGGSLVAGHDPDDHAAAAVAYLQDRDLAARTGRAGVARAGEATWDHSAERMLDAYRTVLDERRSEGTAHSALRRASTRAPETPEVVAG